MDTVQVMEEGRKGSRRDMCVSLCVSVSTSVRINPKVEVGLAGDIWLRRMVNNSGASHVPGHVYMFFFPHIYMCYLPPHLVLTALRFYYSVHFADEKTDVQRLRPQHP